MQIICVWCGTKRGIWYFTFFMMSNVQKVGFILFVSHCKLSEIDLIRFLRHFNVIFMNFYWCTELISYRWRIFKFCGLISKNVLRHCFFVLYFSVIENILGILLALFVFFHECKKNKGKKLLLNNRFIYVKLSRSFF